MTRPDRHHRDWGLTIGNKASIRRGYQKELLPATHDTVQVLIGVLVHWRYLFYINIHFWPTASMNTNVCIQCTYNLLEVTARVSPIQKLTASGCAPIQAKQYWIWNKYITMASFKIITKNPPYLSSKQSFDPQGSCVCPLPYPWTVIHMCGNSTGQNVWICAVVGMIHVKIIIPNASVPHWISDSTSSTISSNSSVKFEFCFCM